MTYFDDNGMPVTAEHRTAVDEIGPLDVDVPRTDINLAAVVFRIGASFREGNPAITAAAWNFLIRGEDESMRQKAKRLGFSTAALSRRARILAESFGLNLSSPHIRELRRRLAKESWARRKKRRAVRNRPAAVSQNSSNPPTKEATHE